MLSSDGQAERLATWRDSVRPANELRRTAPIAPNSPASQRAALFRAAVLIATAPSMEERADTLSDWCVAAGVRRLWPGIFSKLSSRTMINTVDYVSAGCRRLR